MHLMGRTMKIVDVIDDIKLNESVGELLDRLSVLSLRDLREIFIDAYEQTLDGMPTSMFKLNDPEAEAFEISRRIEALDLILAYTSSGHEPYDFTLIDWWDNESEDESDS